MLGEDVDDSNEIQETKSLRKDIDPKRYDNAKSSCIKERIVDGTPEFNTCVEKKLGLKTCSTSTRGRCINYSKDHPSYMELDPYEKMNYAVYMIDYNVNEKQEFAQGLSSTKSLTTGSNTADKFILNESVMMFLKPQGIISTMTFICFILILLMIVILIIMYIADVILSMFGVNVISPIKKSVMMWMSFALILIYLLIFIIDYVYNKVQSRLEIINYNIK